MTWTVQWHKVVFTDEKRFNLDGPDGFNYYFHDLKKDELFLSRRHNRTAGVMIWGAISYYGPIQITIVDKSLTAISYVDILKNARPQINELFGRENWALQQDNAPIHNANLVQKWLHKKKFKF